MRRISRDRFDVPACQLKLGMSRTRALRYGLFLLRRRFSHALFVDVPARQLKLGMTRTRTCVAVFPFSWPALCVA